MMYTMEEDKKDLLEDLSGYKSMTIQNLIEKAFKNIKGRRLEDWLRMEEDPYACLRCAKTFADPNGIQEYPKYAKLTYLRDWNCQYRCLENLLVLGSLLMSYIWECTSVCSVTEMKRWNWT